MVERASPEETVTRTPKVLDAKPEAPMKRPFSASEPKRDVSELSSVNLNVLSAESSRATSTPSPKSANSEKTVVEERVSIDTKSTWNRIPPLVVVQEASLVDSGTMSPTEVADPKAKRPADERSQEAAKHTLVAIAPEPLAPSAPPEDMSEFLPVLSRPRSRTQSGSSASEHPTRPASPDIKHLGLTSTPASPSRLPKTIFGK